MTLTQELEHQIKTSRTPEILAGDVFDQPALTTYLNNLLHEHGLTVQDVVVGCNLDRSYAYQLFNGTRKPTRDFLLRFSFLLGLPDDEAQRLLKIAGRQPLYARNRRDAAVLYGLTHGLTLEETDSLLCQLSEKELT